MSTQRALTTQPPAANVVPITHRCVRCRRGPSVRVRFSPGRYYSGNWDAYCLDCRAERQREYRDRKRAELGDAEYLRRERERLRDWRRRRCRKPRQS